MSLQFKRAVREGGKGRVGIIGPSGSGKSYSGLAMLAGMGKKLAVIDTENGSLSKYVGEIVGLDGEIVEWDALNLTTFSPLDYIEAMEAARGYDAVLIDSLSHAWFGKGGQLEQVDSIAKRSQSGNTFSAWRDVSPQHNKMIEAIIRAPYHLIVTMRSKVEWVLEENERGKKVPKKIGTAPIQKDGMEYELDIVGDINLEHEWIISKTRARFLDGQVVLKPTAKLGKQIADWVGSGVAPEPKQKTKDELLSELIDVAKQKGMGKAVLAEWVKDKYSMLPSQLNEATINELIANPEVFQ